jgi:hypothetical protein
MKKIIFIGIGVLIISSISFAEIIKLNCARTDYKGAENDILLIDLNKNIMKIKEGPDYRIRKITDHTIEGENSTNDVIRSLEFKRYTGKLHYLIFDIKENKSIIDWYYQCAVGKKII